MNGMKPKQSTNFTRERIETWATNVKNSLDNNQQLYESHNETMLEFFLHHLWLEQQLAELRALLESRPEIAGDCGSCECGDWGGNNEDYENWNAAVEAVGVKRK